MQKDLASMITEALQAWKKQTLDAGIDLPSEDDIRSDVTNALETFIAGPNDETEEDEEEETEGSNDNGGDDKKAA